MKNRSNGFLRVMIVFFMFVLIVNAFVLAINIKSDMSYKNRSYGLSAMNDCFNNGEYYKIYRYALKNALVDEKPYVDVSQYEAFGRFYHAYMMAKLYPDNDRYRLQMNLEKAQISWKKILNVIAIMEDDLNKQ